MLYDYRQAWVCGHFYARSPVPASGVVKMAKRRSGSGEFPPLSERFLEYLDRVGLFRPIAFATGPYMSSPYWPDQLQEPVWTFDKDYVSWDEYRWDIEGYPPLSMPLYSPWQILYLFRGLRLLCSTVDNHVLVEQSDSERSKQMSQFASLQLKRAENWDIRHRRETLILIFAQNRYWPLVSGSYPVARRRDSKEEIHISEIRDSIEPTAVLEENGVDVSQVKKKAEEYWLLGEGEDPLVEVSDLVDEMPWKKRQLLRGAALRAQDYFDAARVLSLLFSEVTGEDPPQGRRQRTTATATSDVSLDDRLEQKVGSLLNYGLYPHAVHVVVEGPTDKDLLEDVLRRMGVDPSDSARIDISSLKGIGQLNKHKEIWSFLNKYAPMTLLAIDREGDAPRDIRKWKEAGIIREDQIYLWDKNIEEDNFSPAELVEAARRIAHGRGYELDISEEDLLREHEDAQNMGRLKVLIGLMSHPGHGELGVSKTEFPPVLVDIIEEFSNQYSWDEAKEKYKVLELAERIGRYSQLARRGFRIT